MVFVDTPGVHQPGYELNRRMMALVQEALMGVDLVCLIRDASVSTGNGDRFVLDLVKRSEKPALLLLNKIDRQARGQVSVVAFDRLVPQRVRLARGHSDFSAQRRDD